MSDPRHIPLCAELFLEWERFVFVSLRLCLLTDANLRIFPGFGRIPSQSPGLSIPFRMSEVFGASD